MSLLSRFSLWRATRKLRTKNRAALLRAEISTGVVRGAIWLRLTPLGSDGTVGDQYCPLSGVDAVRLSRRLAKLAKRPDVA